MQKYLAAFNRIFSFLRPNPEDGRKWTEKLRDKYRLVIMNDETFEEVSSFKLSPLSVYVLFSSLVVGTAFLVTLLIVYTPLKRYIPGYGDFTRDSEIAELTSKVRNFEREVEASRRYQENIRKILLGDVESMTRNAAEQRAANDSTASQAARPENVERIDEDQSLRNAVASGAFTGNENSTSEGIGSREMPIEQVFFMPPVSGEITAAFDPSKDHFGIDVSAPRNTAIKSAATGVVISSGFSIETGYTIAIQHPNNVITMYKHNSVLLKKAGSSVQAGEAIAIIGNTGEMSSGPHLHFELWYKGRPVNPGDFINFK